MNEHYRPPKRTWAAKFRDAFRGVGRGVRGQSSFTAHFVMTALVAAAAAALGVTLWQWCALALCVTIVLAAETFNSALESLAKAIDSKHNLHLEDGLDIASGAVLVCALGAALVGAMIFLERLWTLLGPVLGKAF